MGALVTPISVALTCRVEEPSTASKADICIAAKSNSLTSRSAQRPERSLGDFEYDEERDRRRRDEIVRRRQVVAGHTDQPSRDERREATEHRHRDVVTD